MSACNSGTLTEAGTVEETSEEGTAIPPTTTPNTGTATRLAASSAPRTTGTSSAPTTSSTSSTGTGFHTASIASGVTVALFGAALSLF
ncbi:hypothetical protein CPB86DRAFT_782679 [Serendipita vermifera]|nr:hypothetical protein CPB86DRAFT_782679 [Serendipita vermifera]